jgi:threonine aldolase
MTMAGTRTGGGAASGADPKPADADRLSLASDNEAGAHPEILEAVVRANTGRCPSYGGDAWSEAALARIRAHFGERAEAFFVFNGTGANVIALKSLTRAHEALLCADSSHLWQDECGAPERFLGCKIVPIPARQGKLEPRDLLPFLRWQGTVHHSQPAAVSITQSTEWGTVYRPEEIGAIVELARTHGLRVHMDGARLANAAARLDLPLRALTTDLGIDAVSFGGTKNGLLFGEAVVFPDPERIPEHGALTGFHRKQATQLASKMRFLSAQIDALLANDLWLRNARHANAMAQRLERGVTDLKNLEIVQPVEVNALFVAVPREALPRLEAHARFHVWDPQPERPVLRWMTAFDTRPDDIDRFVARVAEIVDG